MILSVRYTSASTAVAITMHDGTVWHTDAALPADTDIRRALREWLDAGNVPEPYAPAPAPMPTLTARQLRLGLLALGVTGAQVDGIIAAIPDAQAREAASIEWEYATSFDRAHPLVTAIGAGIGLDAAQIDDAWRNAATL